MKKHLGVKPPKFSAKFDEAGNNIDFDIMELAHHAEHMRQALLECAEELEQIREYYPKSILAKEGWLPRLAKKCRISAGDIDG